VRPLYKVIDNVALIVFEVVFILACAYLHLAVSY